MDLSVTLPIDSFSCAWTKLDKQTGLIGCMFGMNSHGYGVIT